MAADRAPEQDQKKSQPWRTPKLTEYGHIGKLTQGSSGARPEPGSRKR
jgi:hypothetical protein